MEGMSPSAFVDVIPYIYNIYIKLIELDKPGG
jgi:hypothetical protein